MAEPPARPRVISWCAWLIMIGSAFLVLSAFQHVADLGSMESQESARALLDDPPVDGLGLSVGDVQQIQQVLSLVAGGAGAATAILGFEVLRRSRTARRVLTILAPVLLFAGSVVAGLLAFVVVVAIVMLWSPQAREWFGDPPRARPEPTPEPAPVAWPPPAETPREGGTAVLAPPAAPTTWPSAPAQPVSHRPGRVLAAGVVTWVTCALVSLGALASLVLVLAAPDDLLEQLREQNPQLEEQGIGDGFVVAVVVATVAGLVLWCLAASVLAFLVVRRHRWAAITLFVSGAVAAALCLVSLVIGNVVALVPLAGIFAVGILLNRPDSKAWFKR